MRKFIVCSTASLLLMAGGMQIRLVAEDSPAPIPNTKTAAAPGIESITIDQAKAMVTAAEKAYEFSMNPPMDSSVNFEQAYTWSRRWLQAAVDAAGNAEERQRAYREHRDRMKSVLDFVQERVSIGFRGFDSYQLAAAQFYLAEANLWLAQQESKAVRASEKPVVFNANASQHVEVYPIHNADPDLVVKVVQSALAGAPDVRLAVDAINNSIVAQARPSEHAKIRELVNKLDVKPRELVVKSATGDGVKPAAPGLEMVTRTAPGMPASTRVTYEVKSPAELIKILQPLLAGQSRVEMKSLGNNSQLIVSAPAEQQDAIRALVTHLEPPAKDVVRLIEPQKRIVAKFTNVDVDTAQKMLPQIAPADSNYEVIYDFHDKSLVVKAPPVKNGERNLEPGDLRRDEEPSERK